MSLLFLAYSGVDSSVMLVCTRVLFNEEDDCQYFGARFDFGTSPTLMLYGDIGQGESEANFEKGDFEARVNAIAVEDVSSGREPLGARTRIPIRTAIPNRGSAVVSACRPEKGNSTPARN